MMDMELLESQLAELPLYGYFFIDPKELEFSDRIRWICEHECPMCGRTWACPPGVGTVQQCKDKVLSHENCLMIATIVEVNDITDINETLATRPEHEEISRGLIPMCCPRKPAPSVSIVRTWTASPAAIRTGCTPAWKATASM